MYISEDITRSMYGRSIETRLDRLTLLMLAHQHMTTARSLLTQVEMIDAGRRDVPRRVERQRRFTAALDDVRRRVAAGERQATAIVTAADVHDVDRISLRAWIAKGQRDRRRDRNAEIVELARLGWNDSDIAGAVGVGRATVSRVIRAAKRQASAGAVIDRLARLAL